jgi:hypothetical protein
MMRIDEARVEFWDFFESFWGVSVMFRWVNLRKDAGNLASS